MYAVYALMHDPFMYKVSNFPSYELGPKAEGPQLQKVGHRMTEAKVESAGGWRTRIWSEAGLRLLCLIKLEIRLIRIQNSIYFIFPLL